MNAVHVTHTLYSGFAISRFHCFPAASFTALFAALIVALLSAPFTNTSCQAGPLNPDAPKQEAFYQQLLKMPSNEGYQPTRSFTIVTDADNGNRLVADDDPNLRFNLLWMDQFQPGYKSKKGGSALGEVVRSYVKTAYKAYRARNAQGTKALPDENGSLRTRSSYSSEMDYNVRVTDDEVRVKVEYSF